MTTLTPYQAGAAAFAAGTPHDGHGKQAGDPTIDQWQAGWRAARDARDQDRYDRLTRPQADVMRRGFKPRINPTSEELMRALFPMVLPSRRER